MIKERTGYCYLLRGHAKYASFISNYKFRSFSRGLSFLSFRGLSFRGLRSEV